MRQTGKNNLETIRKTKIIGLRFSNITRSYNTVYRIYNVLSSSSNKNISYDKRGESKRIIGPNFKNKIVFLINTLKYYKNVYF